MFGVNYYICCSMLPKASSFLQVSARQSSSGISWTTFEDQVTLISDMCYLNYFLMVTQILTYVNLYQALVVLVHDMGPNWELVSDAINSTLQFKVKQLMVLAYLYCSDINMYSLQLVPSIYCPYSLYPYYWHESMHTSRQILDSSLQKSFFLWFSYLI